MEKKYLIGAGVIALGIFAYSRYAKKDDSGQGEDQGGGGGGIGGGGFLGALVNPITNQPTTPSTPSTPTKVGITPTTITNKKILEGLGVGKPVAATTNLPTNTGVTGTGITGIGTSGTKPSSTSTSVGSGSGVIAGAGSTMTGSSGTVFKLFDGSESKCKSPIYLNDLVRSWNRP